MASKPKVFIASSREGLNLAYAIQANLEHETEPDVWNQGIMNLTSSVLDGLIDSLAKYQFAIFVFSSDDKLDLREQKYIVARDNVVLELGLFIGKLGKDRCFIVQPREVSDFHLPADLLGIIPADYDPKRTDLQAALGPACFKIKQRMSSLATAVKNYERTSASDRVSVSADQVAAVCYRILNGNIQFYLVRTSNLRWIFPKGYPDTAQLAAGASREAKDEAGASGFVSEYPFTTFTHYKSEARQTLRIAAFLLKVEKTQPPREPNRNPKWHSLEEAIKALAEKRTTQEFLEFAHVLRAAVNIISNEGTNDGLINRV